MKNFILASSLAVLAAGKTTTTPSVSVKSMSGAKSNAKTIRKMVDAERRNIRKASKADAKIAKAAVMEAKTVAKDEGAVFSDAHSYADFFEISQGMSDCSTTVGRVEGFEAYRCMDYIIADSDGMGMTESEMMIKPNNYGFPIFYFFDGHGCREENIIGHWRMPKTEFGFAPDYKGGCMPMYEDGAGPSTVTPSFHQEAMWTYMRHEPMYPAVMQGIDGKDKGCRRGKYDMYEVIAAGLCRFSGDDDSTTPEFSYFDVSNCYNGTVEEKFFSDPYCSTMTHSKWHSKEDCVFDVEEFQMYLMEEGDAALEYRSRSCTYGSAP